MLYAGAIENHGLAQESMLVIGLRTLHDIWSLQHSDAGGSYPLTVCSVVKRERIDERWSETSSGLEYSRAWGGRTEEDEVCRK